MVDPSLHEYAGHEPPDFETCRVVETHISRLFFTPDRVYKLLKPIRTGFLDHTDATRRMAAIDAELALNRRLAPDVYLGSADLCEGEVVVDRLIIMKRLPDDRRLSVLATQPGFDEHLRTVARAVAAFHAGLPPVTESVPLSTADGLSGFWRSSIDDMRPLVGKLFESDEFDDVERLTHKYLDHHATMFEHRRSAGFVRDGHGDLTAGDIFMLDDGPRILDCLAFDDTYRISDVLADVAFLVMDVERLAGSEAARRLLRWYCEFTGEHHPSSLAHHYVAYRAHVRAKVAALRWTQGDAASAAEARQYHAQACDHLRRAQVSLVLLGGGPGTGKSTLAGALSGAMGWPVVDADSLRKDLRGIDHDDHHVDLHPDLYSEATTEQTYCGLIDHAATLLDAGESVVLDATWARADHREQARRAAHQHGARLIELECHVDPAVAKARIDRRQRSGTDPSDATPDLVGARRDVWRAALPVDTSDAVDSICDWVIARTLTR